MTDFAELAGAPFSVFNFQAPGPIGHAYMMASDPISLIKGPVGSGKTSASIFKCALQSLRMPIGRDGVVRAKGCVVRDNYRTLYRTTLPSWFNFFPKDFPGSSFEGGQDRPAKHTLRFRTPKGTKIEMIVEFFAIGDTAIEELLKGWEGSWGWLNEADLLHENVPGFLYSRTGRYPSRATLADPDADMPRTVFGDLNPPAPDHWVYQNCVEEPLPGWILYEQPGGLSDQAENRIGVKRSYYEELARTLPKNDVRRFVHGLWGYPRDGVPVYGDDFNEAVHIAQKPIPLLPGLPLHAGLDQGFSPAWIPFQIAPSGQIRFLGEIVPPHGTGVGRFSAMLVHELAERFRDLPLGTWSSDPAGFYGADKIAGELSWTETVAKAVGHPILPAPSQEPAIRSEALRLPMTLMVDAHTPGLLVDPSAKMLKGGLAAHFKFRKQRQGSRDVIAERWEKNAWSHPVEAAQYGVLGVRGMAGIINQAAKAGRPGTIGGARAPVVVAGDFDVMRV